MITKLNGTFLRWTLLRVLPALLSGLILATGCQEKPEHKPASHESSVPEPQTPQYDRYWNDVARYLAGLEVAPGSKIDDFAHSSASMKQREFFVNSWDRIEESRLGPMRSWQEKYLASLNPKGRVVFYPFGGPDFLHVSTFFPEASDYVQFGLEPPGLPPDIRSMGDEERSNLLYLTRTSLHSVLQFSFFRTNDMKHDLIQSRMGAAPILMAFAVRNGYRVLDVQSVHINKNGEEADGAGGDSRIPGIRILIQKGEHGSLSTIHYYSLDISDSATKLNSPFFKWMKSKGRVISYAKGASYLMHRDSFSHIRDLILDSSDAFLQDDSAIPYRFFSPEKWDITLFGQFDGPIAMFRGRNQQDLRKAYRESEVQELPFGIGYVYREGKSNLMLVRKRPANSPSTGEMKSGEASH